MTDELIRRKYTRTYHVEWSKGVQSDDKILKDLSCFEGLEIVVTEKLDGECTTLTSSYMHARSIDSLFNYTRSWVSNMHSGIKYSIPNDIRLVGENLWGKHSISYPDNSLEGYFYLFSVWKEKEDGSDFCLDYDSIVEYSEMFDLPMPKVLYRGVFCEKKLRELSELVDTSKSEGYVIRTTKSFDRKDSNSHLAKWVREGHVQPNSKHWLKDAKQNGKLKLKVKPKFMGK